MVNIFTYAKNFCIVGSCWKTASCVLRGKNVFSYCSLYDFMLYYREKCAGDGDESPASWKRVTHSDSYRVAANCPVGAAAGFAADGGDPSGRQAAA
jgi:hypothetical protein